MAKILVIDDDPDIVLSVRMTLEAEGYEVISAPGGKVVDLPCSFFERF